MEQLELALPAPSGEAACEVTACEFADYLCSPLPSPLELTAPVVLHVQHQLAPDWWDLAHNRYLAVSLPDLRWRRSLQQAVYNLGYEQHQCSRFAACDYKHQIDAKCSLLLVRAPVRSPLAHGSRYGTRSHSSELPHPI